MEEKKLTDEENIKALEWCGTKFMCKGCPKYGGEVVIDYHKCKKDLIKQSIDLIRRLQYGFSSASKASEEWKAKYEKERNENAEQKAEIERLKGFLQTFKTVIKEKDEQIEQRLEEVYADFMKEYKIAKQDLKESLEREVELQMQVDEIKSDISKAIENYKKEMPTAIKEAEKKIEEMQQQAVKYTAKEILEQVRFLIEERNCVGGYDLEDETIDGTIFVEVLNELKERYGVEVE